MVLRCGAVPCTEFVLRVALHIPSFAVGQWNASESSPPCFAVRRSRIVCMHIVWCRESVLGEMVSLEIEHRSCCVYRCCGVKELGTRFGIAEMRTANQHPSHRLEREQRVHSVWTFRVVALNPP
jgi:hypothetical protein